MSKEHIIPESLGNIDHTLPPGWVCDCCNNYLARKVEAPFLNDRYGKLSRFEMSVPSKKGRVPVIQGVHLESMTELDFSIDLKQNTLMFTATNPNNMSFLMQSIKSQRRGSFIIPHSATPLPSYEVSRLIGKIAIEVLALRNIEKQGWNDEVVDKRELDELRSYARYGKKGFVWPVHIEQIYEQDHEFSDEDFPDHQILHEFNILFIPDEIDGNIGEFYAVIAIFGVQYTINLGGPEIDGYLKWLELNEGKSFLYM